MLEREFWAQASGLAPAQYYSLQDHRRQAWASILSAPKSSNYDDLAMGYLLALGIAYSGINGMWQSFWASLSGLTPSRQYSMADHRAAALALNPNVPGLTPTNYAPNGDFESGVLTPWTLDSGVTGTIDSTIKHGGSYSAKVVNGGTSGGGLNYGSATPVLSLTKKYIFSGWIYVTVLGSSLPISVQGFITDWNSGYFTRWNIDNPALNTWLQFSATYDMALSDPGSSGAIMLYVGVNGGTTAYVDDLSVLQA